MEENYSPEMLREIGKDYFFNNNGDAERRSCGIRFILKAHSAKDPEATFIVARLIMDGVLRSSAKDQNEYALELICSSANHGCIQARAFLNAFCEERYREKIETFSKETDTVGALLDFDGKPIKINRQGIFTPIDAVLEYRDGRNVLSLSANLAFLQCEVVANLKRFKQAVYDGILAWQGEYEVFGGQRLSVEVALTEEDRLYDNLFVSVLTNEMGEMVKSISNVIHPKDIYERNESIINDKRSFATGGIKWSVSSRKFIFLQSLDSGFEDYAEIMHVVKHEFGHALGLGDLYASRVDFLDGVEKGTYYELDGYFISNRDYNLVMCDHYGPISNNDVEMVILAFRENKMQHYQKMRLRGKISSALGKGN